MNNTPDINDPDILTCTVPNGAIPVRLDKFLADTFPDFSRTRLKSLIEEGFVSVNDTPVTAASFKPPPGTRISFAEPELVDANPIPENIPLDIVYEDDDLLVINKDADMVVHPAVGHPGGTLVNALLYHCGDTLSGIGGVKRPGIVHRLDRGTSGLMIVAKNDAAHAHLSTQLATRALGRIYHAVVFKHPLPPLGTIDKPVGRNPNNRLKMGVGGKDAREAITHYKTLVRYGADTAALVECRLSTGRTHQIRVHMASIGHPLLGDPLYGPQETALYARLKNDGHDGTIITRITGFPRQALHAHELHFIHPKTGRKFSFSRAYPNDFLNLIGELK